MGSLSAVVLAACVCLGGETVLLDFYSDTCPPCRAMDPVVRQLAAQGYPIQKINVQREPGLASRFGVRGIPCFVMLVDGREVDRVVGATSSGRLEQMLARARPSSPGNNPGSVPLPAVVTGATFVPGSPSVAVGSGLNDLAQSDAAAVAMAQAVRGQESGASSARDQGRLGAELIAVTVRLRIEDSGGHSCGSGTIIDTRGHEALILTCGHLFRDSQGKGRIEVDLFGPNAAERIPGELVHYDLKKDLALLKIRVPGPVRAARVAPPGYPIAKGARVVNVGCNNGQPPTIRYAHVTALDKFLGPSNVEVSGLPVQGRSGGGLFTADGLVIGVCNAAVPTDNEGLYAALASIHAELDQAELPFVYRQPAADSPTQTAIAGTDPPSMPKRMPPPSDLVQLTEAPGQPPTAPGPAPAEGDPPLTPDQRAALEEIQRRKAEGAELICIIRSRTDPNAPSEVIVLDRVSPAFLKQLTTDPPPQPTKPTGASAAPSSQWRPRWLESGYQGS